MNKIQCEFDEDRELIINDNSYEYANKCAFGKRSKAKHYIKKFYDNHKFRYALEYKLNENQGKTIAIILMNPSFADNNHLDNTLYNVKKFIENLDKNNEYSKFIVLNIFPIRTPNSDRLIETMDNYKLQQEKNDNTIFSTLSEVKDVIVAWGGNYHKVAKNKEWFKKLKSKSIAKYAYGINQDGTPKHFSPYAYDYNKIDYENTTLDNYKVEFKNNEDIFIINS